MLIICFQEELLCIQMKTQVSKVTDYNSGYTILKAQAEAKGSSECVCALSCV